MITAKTQADGEANPLAISLEMLGHLIRDSRICAELDLIDAADLIGVSAGVLARIESGKSVGTDRLFKVLTGFGLALLVTRKGDAEVALRALGHTANWPDIKASQPRARERDWTSALVLDNNTPTLFVDYDGTLHAGHALIDETGHVTLDTGRPLFEFAPLLVEMLAPHPSVEIVLTTSWLHTLPEDKVIAYLPPELAQRVVDTTQHIPPRFSYLQNGSGRTDVITCYAFGKRLNNWLAIDDSVFDAFHFGREPGELVKNFLLLDSASGITDEEAQRRIREWLAETR
ncbi:MAG: HAD domain-containing protein [Paraburkholderia sp.]|uniref:HAD domain-containing protein n=1 Tax=Paraburkholderia sp. TaxID=1926495 RepID=UPI003C49D432